MAASPTALYLAWTEQLDSWFAAPGTVLMRGGVNEPYFFETHFEGAHHPHYGRFLALEPDRRIEMTWVTGHMGTEGAETVVTVDLAAADEGTCLRLTHSGFRNEEARDRTAEAWPKVLAHLDEVLTADT